MTEPLPKSLLRAPAAQERAKFKSETLTNTNGRTRSDSLGGGSDDDTGLDQWLCITLLLAVEGLQLKIPRITGMNVGCPRRPPALAWRPGCRCVTATACLQAQ
jgi:hypothetical protein